MNIRDQVKKDLGDFPSPPSGDLEPALNLPAGLQMLRGGLKIVINLTLNLIYLPHLDYDQRYGPHDPKCRKALSEIDEIAGSLIDFFSERGVDCLVLSEYGITETNKVIYPNRVFRHQGWLQLKEEFGLETWIAGVVRRLL